MRITQAQVARQAGVTQGMVSAVFSGSGSLSVNPETRERILRAAQHLGYAPRSQSLQLDAYAFIYANDKHEGMRRMIQGFQDAAHEKRQRVMMLPTAADLKKEVEFLGRLREFDVKGAAALLLVAKPEDQLQMSRLISASTVPTVLLGLDFPGFSAAAVMLDNFYAGYAMTKYLIGRGLGRIGFFSNHSWIQFMRDRYLGYRWAMEEAGFSPAEEWIHLEAGMEADFVDPLREPTALATCYLQQAHGIEAVVCADDFLASGMVRAARESGKQVPQDLRVTGIDDFAIAHQGDMALTTYRVPYENIGRRGFETLDAIVAKTFRGDRQIKVRGELVVRESA